MSVVFTPPPPPSVGEGDESADDETGTPKTGAEQNQANAPSPAVTDSLALLLQLPGAL